MNSVQTFTKVLNLKVQEVCLVIPVVMFLYIASVMYDWLCKVIKQEWGM